MSNDEDPATVLTRLAALSRERQNAFRMNEPWSDSLIARIKECERLADKTVYPERADMMRKLARLWRELARSLPTRT